MESSSPAEDAGSAATNVVLLMLVFIGLVAVVLILVRRIRRDRRIEVNEDIRVAASVDEVAARIVTALGAIPKAQVSQPAPWQYVVVVKHISAGAVGLLGVILASLARTSLTLQVAMFQEAGAIVVRLQGTTELSILQMLRLQIATDTGS